MTGTRRATDRQRGISVDCSTVKIGVFDGCGIKMVEFGAASENTRILRAARDDKSGLGAGAAEYVRETGGTPLEWLRDAGDISVEPGDTYPGVGTADADYGRRERNS